MRCDAPRPVPVHGFRFTLTRVIRASLRSAFAWWTDFDPGDARLARTGRLASRAIVRRDAGNVWKRDVNRFMGLRVPVDSRVSLHPPDQWTLVSESALHGVRGHYQLSPDGAGCRLTAHFHVFARRAWVRPVFALLGGRIGRRQGREWDHFIAALEAERGASDGS